MDNTMRYALFSLVIFVLMSGGALIGESDLDSLDKKILTYTEDLQSHPPDPGEIRSVLEQYSVWYDAKSADFQYLNFQYEALESRTLDLILDQKPQSAVKYMMEHINVLKSLAAETDRQSQLNSLNPFPRNPHETTVTSAEGTKYNLYFGDLHIHCNKSYDARRSPAYCLSFARDVSKLDFAGLSDHAFKFKNPREVWNDLLHINNRFNAPGEFVVFNGYEYGGRFGQGHRNVVFKGNDVPEIPMSWIDQETNTIRKLWNWANDYEVLLIPHHPAYSRNSMGNNWKNHFLGHEPVVELLSIHGNSEHVQTEDYSNAYFYRFGAKDRDRTVQAALAQGIRFGFIGGSDTHRGKPGYYDSTFAERPGLTGVFAPELSRSAVFESIKSKRCFATNGEKIFLYVSLNGIPMGSDVTLSLDQEQVMEIIVRGTTDIERVEILKNNQVTHVIEPGKDQVQLQISVYEPSSEDNNRSKLVRYTLSDKSTDYYYVRVTQSNGGKAWSSPVWVDYGYPD